MAIKATYLGSNGWIIELKKTKIVIDPWLLGELIFPPGEWFFKGTLKDEIPTPNNVDLILLTQGLPDHCHIESLLKFPKNTEIFCPKSALNILEEAGFEKVNVITPGQKKYFKDLEIEATEGARVPQVENGYLVKDDINSFYIEPHGFIDKSINPRKLDAVITPTINLDLPLIGAFVKGADVIPNLINTFDPDYILSSTIGGDAEFSGILNKFIKVNEFKEQIDCKLITLKSLETIKI